MSRFLKTFISVSVLINLLLAGIVIGNVGRHYITGTHMRYTVQEMAGMLPADQRRPFEATMQRAEQDTGELRQQKSDARKKAASLLKAEPFDKKAYLAQMQELQRLNNQIMQRMAEAIAQLAAESTPAQRATLADILRHPPRASNDD